MSTNENNAGVTATQSSQPQSAGMFHPVDQDFNFDMVGTNSVESVVQENPAQDEAAVAFLQASEASQAGGMEETAQVETDSSAFDFSLDLPGAYAEAPIVVSWVERQDSQDTQQHISSPQPITSFSMESLQDGDVQPSNVQETSVSVAETPVMNSPFAGDEVEVEIDPFEAMRASLQDASAVEEMKGDSEVDVQSKLNIETPPQSSHKSSVSSDTEMQTPVMGVASISQVPSPINLSEPMPQQEKKADLGDPTSAISDVDSVHEYITPVSDSASLPLNNGGLNAGTEIPVEMPSPSSPTPSQFSLESLEAIHVPESRTSSVDTSIPTMKVSMSGVEGSAMSSEPSTMPSGMLSLDEMIAQPIAQSESSNGVASVGMNAVTGMNAISAPVAYPNMQIPAQNLASQTSKSSMTTAVGMLGVLVLCVLGGVMAYLKYPTFFQEIMGGELSSPALVDQTLSLDGEGDLQHGVAPEEGTGDVVGEGEVSSVLSGDGALAPDLDVNVVEVTDEELALEVQEIVLEDGGKEDVSLVENSLDVQTGVIGTQEDELDSLSAVEDLVGPINNTDTLAQQISSYKLQAQNIADTGKAQSNRSMVKRGVYVVNQVEKIEQGLANGMNMTISEWNAKKAELDISLAKAYDA